MNLRRVVTGAGVLVALALLAPPAAGRTIAQKSLADTSVTVAVTDMSPTTPKYTATPSPLTISLTLTNTTGQQLDDVSVDVDRDAPVTQQKLLDQLMAKPAPSHDQSVLSPLPPIHLDTPLQPHEARRLTYTTTTSSANDGKGLCLCFETGGGIYPINFTVTAAGALGGGTTEVGFGQTYLPAFKDTPKPVQVSWVWPLVDRPHRLLDGTFVDDDLATSVAPGGRLDRALRVVEKVAPLVHLTLVIDPELIDELATMSQPYTVDVNDKKATGTGTAAAKAWLARLRAVISWTQVSLTAYADPDVDTLSQAGLTWRNSFGTVEQQQLQSALGVPPQYDVAWPPNSVITSDALGQVVNNGSPSVVVLNDATLPGASQAAPRPNALAPLPAQYGVPGAVAAVTDHSVQKWSSRVLTSGSRSAVLPQLVSELAVRAAEQPSQSHYVVITAPRYVDVNADQAARALLEVARTSWSTSLRLDEAARVVRPVDHGQITAPAAAPRLPSAALDTAQSATTFLHSFTSALSNADASRLVGQLPNAIQRAESAAWQADPERGAAFARRLSDEVSTWQRGVYILRPSNGTYTLASNDSPVPITVVNTLPVDVRVRVSLTTVNGVSGFRADDSRVQTIARAPSATNPTRTTLKIPTRVQRAGTFQVNAVLLAPDGTPIGRPVPPLSIHSTALGAVGVIITAVAGGVLVLALAIRLVRRLRARSRKAAAEATAEVTPTQPLGLTP